MGESSLEDALYTEEVFSAIETEVMELLSGETADTNAYDFNVEDLEATKVKYDEKRGILTVLASFTYQESKTQTVPTQEPHLRLLQKCN